jgi:hypothetical protein
VIPVAPFEVPEALRQLDAELGEARAKAAKEADKRALVTELGGLPLAIALAGSYLRGGRSIPNFLSLYRERLLHLGPDRPNSKATKTPRARRCAPSPPPSASPSTRCGSASATRRRRVCPPCAPSAWRP